MKPVKSKDDWCDAYEEYTEALAAATRSAKSYRGHLTAKLATATRAVELLDANHSAYASEQTQTTFAKAEVAFDQVVEAYLVCMEMDEDAQVQTWETKIQLLTTEMNTLRRKVDSAMNKAPIPLAQAQALPMVNPHQGRMFVNDTLRPPVLTLQNTPIELRSWILKFKSFFTSNQFNQATIPEQQAYVRQFIDPDLEVRIEMKIDAATEIFGDSGMISYIEDEFALRYPLFSRRLDFFRYKRSKGQTVSSFVAHLMQLSGEADLSSLTVDQLMVFRVITGVDEDHLLGKLLEMTEPSFEDVKKKISSWEVAKVAKKSCREAKDGKASQVQQGRGNSQQSSGRRQNQGGKPSQGSSKGIEVTPESLKGKCTVCGTKKHATAQCEYKSKATCKTCNKDGHYASVCLGAYYKNKSSNSQAVKKVQGRSRAPSPTDSADGDVHSVKVVKEVRGRRDLATPTKEIKFKTKQGNSFTFRCIPDSGATKTIIAYDLAQKYGISVDKTSLRLKTANQTPLQIVGSTEIEAWACSPRIFQTMSIEWRKLKLYRKPRHLI